MPEGLRSLVNESKKGGTIASGLRALNASAKKQAAPTTNRGLLAGASALLYGPRGEAPNGPGWQPAWKREFEKKAGIPSSRPQSTVAGTSIRARRETDRQNVPVDKKPGVVEQAKQIGREALGVVEGAYDLGKAIEGVLLGGVSGEAAASRVLSPEAVKAAAEGIGYSLAEPRKSFQYRPVSTVLDWAGVVLPLTQGIAGAVRPSPVSSVPVRTAKPRVVWEGEVLPPEKSIAKPPTRPAGTITPRKATAGALPASKQKALPAPRAMGPGEVKVTPVSPETMAQAERGPKPYAIANSKAEPKPFVRIEPKPEPVKGPRTASEQWGLLDAEEKAATARLQDLAKNPDSVPNFMDASEAEWELDRIGKHKAAVQEVLQEAANKQAEFEGGTRLKAPVAEIRSMFKPNALRKGRGGWRVVGPRNVAVGKGLAEYDWLTLRDALINIENEPWGLGTVPREQAAFSKWLREQVGGRKTTAYEQTTAGERVRRGFGEESDLYLSPEVGELQKVIIDRYNRFAAGPPQPGAIDLSTVTLPEHPTKPAEVVAQEVQSSPVSGSGAAREGEAVPEPAQTGVKIPTRADLDTFIRQELADTAELARLGKLRTVRAEQIGKLKDRIANFAGKRALKSGLESGLDAKGKSPGLREQMRVLEAEVKGLDAEYQRVYRARNARLRNQPTEWSDYSNYIKKGQELPPERAAIYEGQGGKASLDTLFTVTGLGASVPLAVKAMEAWRRGADSEPVHDDETFGSGGVLQDISDLASVGNYLVASIAREAAMPGKQGVIKGVRERRTFSDVLGLPGLVPDIVLDPLNLISPAEMVGSVGKVLKPVVSPVTSRTARLFDGVSKLRSIKRALDVWEYTLGFSLRDDTLAARGVLDREWDKYIIEHSSLQREAQGIASDISRYGRQVDTDVSRVVDAGLVNGRPPADRSKLGWAKQQVLRELEQTKGKPYRDLVSNLYKRVADFEEKISGALVRTEQLTQETADQFRRVHLRRIYSSFDDAEAYINEMAKSDPKHAQQLMSELQAVRSGVKNTPDGALRFSAIMQRAAISDELKAILKEIPESSARIASGAYKSSELAARAGMYQRLAETVALSDEQIERLPVGKIRGYMQLSKDADPATHRPLWGALAGKWVPEAMFYDLMASRPKPPNEVARTIQKLVSWWKFGKVPLSMPTQVRNFATNVILADVLGDVSPYRLDRYYQAGRSLLTQDKWWQEAAETGVFLHDTFVSRELRSFVEAAREAGADKLDGMPFVRKMYEVAGKVLKAPAQMYEFNEKFFKMAVYINARERGAPAEMAADFADRALFNYRKVPRAVNFMRSYGILPFIVFPYKALPALAKSFWTDTGRFAKYPKLLRSVEEMTPDDTRRREKAVMADWMANTYVRLPGGAPSYLDTKYIMPYSDVQDVASSPAKSIMGRVSPGVGLGYELATNRSMFTERPIVPEGLEKLDPGAAKRVQAEYVARALLPSMMPPIPGVLPRGGYAWEGTFAKSDKPAPGTAAGRSRPLGERVMYAAGLKTLRVNIEREAQYRYKALQQLRTALYSQMRKVTHGKAEDQWTPRERREVEAIQDRFMQEAEDTLRRIDTAMPPE